MKLITAAGLALSLAFISAAEAPSNYETYDGVRIDSDPVLLAQYNKILPYCDWEASLPERGSPDRRSMWHILALRSCLYRHNIVDRGLDSYPANAILEHTFEQ